MKYDKRSQFVEAYIFPDNGPEQHELKEWIINNGGQAALVDGVVENNVVTSTNAKWRWKCMYLGEDNKLVRIGDYIVLDKGIFFSYSPDIFHILFKAD